MKRDLEAKIKELEAENEALRKKLGNIKIKGVFTNDDSVMALGILKLSDKYRVVRIGVEYLQKAVKIAKEMGSPSVDIAVANDMPFALGEYDEDKNEVAGILIAPKIR